MSRWKKSQASKPPAWVRRNARQEVSTFRGVGLRRRARKIRRTVASLIWCPSQESSPCPLRYPQAGFSRASRSTRSRISWLVPGRPDRLGYVRLRVIRRRCQASSVPGVTSRLARNTVSSSRASAARTRPVGPVRLGPGDLTPEHRDLMTEHHDLRVLGRLASAEQHQPAEYPDRDQVEQTKSHEPRSWRNQLIRPNRRSQHLQRVIRRCTSRKPAACPA